MRNEAARTLVIIDEQFEKIEGHPYEYDKSVTRIFQEKGIRVIIYGHENMLPSIREELDAQSGFTFKTQSLVRKIPVIGSILYRASFWRKYKKEIKVILQQVLSKYDNCLFFFPNVYWYNVLPIAEGLKSVNVPIALLFRVSIYDALKLPGFMKPLALAITKKAERMLKSRKDTYYFSDSEVIADEWSAYFGSGMEVLPIPHLTPNKKDRTVQHSGKIRMYLPGAMRLEKGARLLTEAFEVLSIEHPEVLGQILLVTQFIGEDEILNGYRSRLSVLPLESVFLKHLSSEEYSRQLLVSDAILIPYQVSEGYRARTSGILAEAIAASKPFITTDGTWMSLQARKFETGIIIHDGQPGELAEALYSLVSSYDHYSDKADKACDRWLQSQSKDIYYGRLAALFNK